MLLTAQHISYRNTALFSKIAVDYIEGNEALRPFYAAAPTTKGLQQAIEAKQRHAVDRTALVQVLKEQYSGVENNSAVLENIDALLSPDTFTVCTAHQPNLFTGPLFFIYKILHAVKLAATLKEQFSQYRFVPVYYMGSEDADKEELLHTYINGKRYEWQTAQAGAVGRMKIDAPLVHLIDEMAGELNVLPFGNEFVELLRRCYVSGNTMQAATFQAVHGLFKKFGLVVLIPDHGVLKKLMQPVFEDDIFNQTPSAIVEKTAQRLSEAYNVQANPREINLFYLAEGIRNRIIRQGDSFFVHDTTIRFTEEELKAELQQHPERFSPNVILRGLFQETILPNVAFIGGGGELAYWLQLKDMFWHYTVPFPVLVLRNSFLIVGKREQERSQKWGLASKQLFEPELQLINAILKQQGKLPQLNGEVAQLTAVYEDLKKLAGGVDVTLHMHVEALKHRALHQLQNLEKKMMRAERKKHEALQNHVRQMKEVLFPKASLQERVENMGPFYAKWGSGFIDELLDHSLSLEQQFTILYET
jgi:bacillithiol biosynthesis cysteine-adding enzyme BshC